MAHGFNQPEDGRPSYQGMESSLPSHVQQTHPSSSGCAKFLLVLGVVFILAVGLVYLRDTSFFNDVEGVRQPLPNGFQQREIEVSDSDLATIREKLERILQRANTADAAAIRRWIKQETLVDRVQQSSFLPYDTSRKEIVQMVTRLSAGPNGYADLRIVSVEKLPEQPQRLVVCAHVAEPGGYYIDTCCCLSSSFAYPSMHDGLKYLANHELCTDEGLQGLLEAKSLYHGEQYDDAMQQAATSYKATENQAVKEGCQSLMQQIVDVTGDFQTWYDLVSDKQAAANYIGTSYRQPSTPMTASTLHDLMVNHLRTSPNDEWARYHLAIAIADQGKTDEAIQALTTLSKSVKDEELKSEIADSRAGYRYQEMQMKELLQEVDNASERFSQMTGTAYESKDMERLRELIKAIQELDDSKEIKPVIAFAQARELALSGETRQAIDLLQALWKASKPDSETKSNVENFWFRLCQQHKDDADLPRPQLDNATYLQHYEDLEWGSDYESMEWMEKWPKHSVPDHQRLSNRVDRLWEANDFSELLAIGEELLQNHRSQLEEHEVDSLKIKLAIADFKRGNHEKAIKRLPRSHLEIAGDIDVRAGRDMGSGEALGSLLQFLDNESNNRPTEHLPKIREYFSDERFQFYIWMKKLNASAKSIDKFSQHLPAWLNSFRRTHRVTFLYSEPDADHAGWIAEFLTGVPDAKLPAQPLELQQAYENITGYRVQIADDVWLFGFCDASFPDQTGAVRHETQELIKLHKAAVFVQLIGNQDREFKPLLDFDWVPARLESVAVDSDQTPLAVYFDPEMCLLKPDSVKEWLARERHRMSADRLYIYLYTDRKNTAAPDSMRRQHELLQKMINNEGAAPIEIAVHAIAGTFKESLWLDFVKWHQTSSANFTLHCKVRSQSNLNPELRPGRHVELFLHDVVDWRIAK